MRGHDPLQKQMNTQLNEASTTWTRQQVGASGTSIDPAHEPSQPPSASLAPEWITCLVLYIHVCVYIQQNKKNADVCVAAYLINNGVTCDDVPYGHNVVLEQASINQHRSTNEGVKFYKSDFKQKKA